MNRRRDGNEGVREGRGRGGGGREGVEGGRGGRGLGGGEGGKEGGEGVGEGGEVGGFGVNGPFGGGVGEEVRGNLVEFVFQFLILIGVYV